jgi:hypothetical protein
MKKAMIDYAQKEKFDDIYTPSYAIKPLLKYIPKNITVWECCDFGGSEITRLLKEHGCNVISTDKEENFFKYQPKEHFDMIITNPPYSLKDDFIKKCYEWEKPFCLLLPITALEGKKRGEMFRKYGIEVLVFDGRVQFMGNIIKDFNKKKNSNWFNTSWFCYKVLPKQLIFEELKKDE